jgi:hypothetical protein
MNCLLILRGSSWIKRLKLELAFVLLLGFEEKIFFRISELSVALKNVSAQNILNGLKPQADQFNDLAMGLLKRKDAEKVAIEVILEILLH